MIDIYEGDAHDVGAIMTVMDDAFDPAFGEAWSASQCLSALAIADCRLLIAKAANGEVTGFALSRWVLDTEELLMIGVATRWQRRNVGSLLLDEIIRRGNEAGRERLFLEVREGNRALDFYAARGFHSIGRRKSYYRGNGDFRPDAITMARDLK